MMNKKAGTGETLKDNLIYLILLVIFFIIMFFFVLSKANSASLWSDYYAKELTKVINNAKPNDEVTLNFHKATEIAQKNSVPSISEIFTFDNSQNKLCVKLSPSRQTCRFYFNNVDITSPEIRIDISSEKNLLSFQIKEKTK
ncbi:hypothetical protein HY450_03885 [Candidatus Pacearchaeota archaeon]|nr:hypothetical protein [Candidatus Pacearchaeota archaeon]